MTKNRYGKKLRIAVIGSGISGLSCSWLLSKHHQVTLFEKEKRFGGHSHTVLVNSSSITNPTLEAQINTAVDTGFIVFNEQTYPNFIAFLKHLKIKMVPTEMSFSVSLEGGELEYSGTNINGIFAQRRNILSPSFWHMLLEILRFYLKSKKWIRNLDVNVTLNELLRKENFHMPFILNHLIPMGAAIWSTPAEKILEYPALSFLRFCENHGLLNLINRPEWQTIEGGSREYVNRVIHELSTSAVSDTTICEVRRFSDRVEIVDSNGQTQTFDHVVMACHADTTRDLLDQPDKVELDFLTSFTFQNNKVLLHADDKLMPKNKRTWASWNYLGSGENNGPSVTYWMNKLQHIPGQNIFVTLNPHIKPSLTSIYGGYQYSHPVFTTQAVSAQKLAWKLQGKNRTWYCGAWMSNGFHEDGIQSGLYVAETLGNIKRPWQVVNENDRLAIPYN